VGALMSDWLEDTVEHSFSARRLAKTEGDEAQAIEVSEDLATLIKNTNFLPSKKSDTNHLKPRKERSLIC